MKRTTAIYSVKDLQKTKQQMLSWANQFNICCFMDNNNYTSHYNKYECLVAVGIHNFIELNNELYATAKLSKWLQHNKDWAFGNINYDFKNSIYPLKSRHQNNFYFSELFLFTPQTVAYIKNNLLHIETFKISAADVYAEINSIENDDITKAISTNQLNIQAKISKQDYCTTINQLKHHLQIGNCYEINFCQEFFAVDAVINSLDIYKKLNAISPTPFSAFYKYNNQYVLCASPERFIQKTDNTIISQPIKGTAKRNVNNAFDDEQLKHQLRKSSKEQSENVMIVDLVRNDLSRIAQPCSVRVDELFGVYSFPQVHQLISTVSAKVDAQINFATVLQALFPMGSMTGAPKFKVMQLIEEYEQSRRGIYSGSIGYITPNNDFDFNVVIRAIMYNAHSQYLSYQVGSAITHYSNAEDEYNECLLKAKAIEAVLTL